VIFVLLQRSRRGGIKVYPAWRDWKNLPTRLLSQAKLCGQEFGDSSQNGKDPPGHKQKTDN